ncbi:MAG: SRPBCC family protein [Mycobacterium sp.]|uniref:SRPBCC family protein n=2 Tax=Mycobacterium sp. TaxID=1785 RepID=UPI003F9C5BED
MKGGIMLTVDRDIEAPPSAVWELLVDLDAWPKWGPTVRGAELDEPHTELALGATGTVQTSLLVSVPFVITEFDPGRHWAWKVAGVPATRHWVEPLGDGARVGMAVPWWSAPYVTVCSIALRRIDAMLTRVSGASRL